MYQVIKNIYINYRFKKRTKLNWNVLFQQTFIVFTVYKTTAVVGEAYQSDSDRSYCQGT